MKWSRRRFLVAGGAIAGMAAAGAVWAASSNRRPARMLRMLAADAKRRVMPAPVKPAPHDWPASCINVCWIGHATVLIGFYGVNILTDPVFGRRIGISLGIGTLGPKRYVASALTFAQLPPIDLLLLSHAHMDHIDLPSLKRFAAETPVVTATDTTDLLMKTRLRRIAELAWGQATVAKTSKGEVQIRAFEVKHWGRRWPEEKNRGYNAYVLKREGRSIIFGGDTAYTRAFGGLRGGGPYDVAIMPIAAYDPWIRNHCTPEEAVQMADMAGARHIVPMHHLTFKLSDEPMNEPLERLEQALRGEPQRLALRVAGETFALA